MISALYRKYITVEERIKNQRLIKSKVGLLSIQQFTVCFHLLTQY